MSTDALRNWILTARRQAEIARTIYLGESELCLLAKTSGAHFRTYQANHIQAAALFYDSHVHLVVCGSNDEYDWFANGNSRVKQVSRPGDTLSLNCHKGFADSAAWLSRVIINTGFATSTFGKTLYLGGHSAGGAIAEILPLIDSRFSPDSIYTFGAPKWCVSDSAAEYRAQRWENHRFVRAYDPVPYLPLTLWRRMLMQDYFVHTSSGIEVTDEGDFLLSDRLSSANRIATLGRALMTGSIATVIGTLKQVPFVSAHDSARYLAALELAVTKRWWQR